MGKEHSWLLLGPKLVTWVFKFIEFFMDVVVIVVAGVVFMNFFVNWRILVVLVLVIFIVLVVTGVFIGICNRGLGRSASCLSTPAMKLS
jgi:hypothetical protein